MLRVFHSEARSPNLKTTATAAVSNHPHPKNASYRGNKELHNVGNVTYKPITWSDNLIIQQCRYASILCDGTKLVKSEIISAGMILQPRFHKIRFRWQVYLYRIMGQIDGRAEGPRLLTEPNDTEQYLTGTRWLQTQKHGRELLSRSKLTEL